jgi:hypothetical protein
MCYGCMKSKRIVRAVFQKIDFTYLSQVLYRGPSPKAVRIRCFFSVSAKQYSLTCATGARNLKKVLMAVFEKIDFGRAHGKLRTFFIFFLSTANTIYTTTTC